MLVENIRQLCKQNNISFAALEIQLGFGNGSIAKWQIHDPSMAKVKAVADYFGVTVDELLK